MSSAARYIASIKSKTIAKSTKVQYQNNIVATNTLTNGVIPCSRISFNPISYIDKICCNDLSQVKQQQRIIYDGGDPYYRGPRILDGGYVTDSLDGGAPLNSGPRTYDGGGVLNNRLRTYDGNTVGIVRSIYDSGNI